VRMLTERGYGAWEALGELYYDWEDVFQIQLVALLGAVGAFSHLFGGLDLVWVHLNRLYLWVTERYQKWKYSDV
jgi:hypothetical protein